MNAFARLAVLGALLAFLPLARAGYRVENIPLPAQLRGGISAVGFSPTGTLVVTTRYGEIWLRTTAGAWRCFARGLERAPRPRRRE